MSKKETGMNNFKKAPLFLLGYLSGYLHKPFKTTEYHLILTPGVHYARRHEDRSEGGQWGMHENPKARLLVLHYDALYSPGLILQ